MKLSIVPIVLSLLCLVLPECAEARAARPGANAITGAAPSPHTAWADALRGPRMRILFIAPRFTLRDVVEVAQRMPVDYETVVLWDEQHVGYDSSLPELTVPGLSAEEVIQRLDALLAEHYDVIVPARFDLAILPEQTQRRVLDAVAAGTGLVLAYPRASGPSSFRDFLASLVTLPSAEAVVRGIGDTGLTGGSADSPIVQLAEYQRGRVVQLCYPGEAPRTHCLVQMPSDERYAYRACFDNSLSLVLRALQWAARRESPVKIVRVTDVAPAGPVAEEIPPDLPPEFVRAMRDSVLHQPMRPYQVELSEAGQRRFRTTVQVLRPGSDIVVTYDGGAVARAGAPYHPIDVLTGPGEHVLNVWLRQGKRVIDWFTQPIHVDGWPRFAGLTCSKTFLLANDTLEVSVDVPSLGIGAVLGQEHQCTIYARATDFFPLASGRHARKRTTLDYSENPRGRLLAEASQTVSGDGGHVALRLGFADLLAPLVTLEVFAVDGGSMRFSNWELNNAYRESRYFAVRQSPRAPATSLLVAAEAPQEYNAQFYLSILEGLGADMAYGPAGETAFFHAAQAGLGFLPELTRLAPARVAGGVNRQPCLSDPAYRESQGVVVRDGTLLHWAGGSRLYSLGNGNCLCDTDENVCQSPDCLTGFRATLKEQYRGLYELNARWGTLFRAWEEVTPCDADAARTSGHFAGYIDFRRYMEGVFAGFHGYARERLRSVDREGQVGFRALGGDNAMHGYDWGRLAAELDFLAVDPDPVTVEKLRSYRHPDAYCGLAFGDRFFLDGPEHARWFAWYAALHQIPALWCMAPYGGADDPAPHAALYPDGRPAPDFEALAGTVRELQHGLGALFLGASRDHTGIAIYESPASRHFSALDLAYSTGSLEAEAVFCRVLERLGYQYNFVDERILQTAALNQYRVLILPMAEALSDAETERIRAFAGRGGTVIADVAPATRDAHGVPRAVPALDAVFGVVREGPRNPVPCTLTANAESGTEAARAWMVRADASVGAGQAEAVAMALRETGPGVPIWLVHREVASQSLLLNHAVSAEAGSETVGMPPWAGLLETVLEEAGCRPILEGLAGNKAAPDAERVRFLYGRADIAALLAPASGGTQKLSAHFPEDSFVYDMRAGKLLPRGREVKLELVPGDVRLYVALPYRVTGLAIASEETAPAGRRLPIRVVVKTDGEAPGAHLIHLGLADSRGQVLRHYGRNLSCRDGTGNTYFPLALNETPGDYRIIARDVLTGIQETRPLRIVGGGHR